MPLRKVNGIVLQVKDFGESDRIVTLFTLELGRIRGIAKSAKRSRKRFGGCLNQFSLLSTILFEKESAGLCRIDHCDLVRGFTGLSADLSKILHGSYMLELANRLIPERDPNEDGFHLLCAALDKLEREDADERLLRIFEVRLARILGYEPRLTSCTGCGRQVRGDGFAFSLEKGGTVCRDCAGSPDDLIPVSAGTLHLLERSMTMSFETVSRLVFPRRSLDECRSILPGFLQYHSRQEFRSLRVLGAVSRGH